jgi:hypothetical protein
MTATTSLASGVTSPAKLHLNVLSNSAIACYRACPRQFKYRYVAKRRPKRDSEALRFGSLFHCGLNAWWITIGDAGDKYAAAIFAMRDRAGIAMPDELASDSFEAFDLIKAEELVLGYTARWGDEVYRTLAVERVFDVPLVNPETGSPSTRYRVSGALDALAERLEDRAIVHVEHKTTSSDLGAGSDYWRKVSALDSQVSTYQAALKALGISAGETLYDVVRKVDLKPYKETVEKSYTKEKSRACKFCTKKGNPPGIHKVSGDDEPDLFCNGEGRVITDPGGRLHANQHEADETPGEYRLRIRAHIELNPERYFARGPIVRLERDEEEHARDIWQTAAMIRLSENSGSFPRNPGACERFHRLCEYFEVCSGNTSIDDDSRFRTAEHAHEELVKEV